MTATEFVHAYMAALMKPDPVLAKTFVGPDFEIIFSGGHKMKDPADAGAFNARRYKWVKKRSERTDTVAGSSSDETVVYNSGTLHGEWPDGTPFEGNRYIDRFVVKNGKIVQHIELNDSAESLLDRAGIPAHPLRSTK
ncbi:nuclear transport factor 2 family protein [Herbaspirillum sp. HC18]|nr:nuclear transport factor 2 family protein [Herbaspirillum sp. HC18]